MAADPRRTAEHGTKVISTVAVTSTAGQGMLLLAANLLTLLFLTSEIFAYWSINDAIQGLREAQFARGMLLSMTCFQSS